MFERQSINNVHYSPILLYEGGGGAAVKTIAYHYIHASHIFSPSNEELYAEVSSNVRYHREAAKKLGSWNHTGESEAIMTDRSASWRFKSIISVNPILFAIMSVV